MDADSLEYRVGRLTIKPGESLVLKIDASLPYGRADGIKQRLAKLVPAGTPIIVLDRSAELSVISAAPVSPKAASPDALEASAPAEAK